MDISKKNKKKNDILEVYVKIKLGVPLTETEKKLYNDLDTDTKNIIDELVCNPSFLYEVNTMMDMILSEENWLNSNIECLNMNEDNTILEKIYKVKRKG